MIAAIFERRALSRRVAGRTQDMSGLPAEFYLSADYQFGWQVSIVGSIRGDEIEIEKSVEFISTHKPFSLTNNKNNFQS